MRRLALGSIGVIVCAVWLAVGAAAVEPPAKGKARLVVAQKAPLVLRGLGFKPAQRVTLTVVTEGRRFSRQTVSSNTGSFRVTFARLAVDPCELEARAASRGALAVYNASERMCPTLSAP